MARERTTEIVAEMVANVMTVGVALGDTVAEGDTVVVRWDGTGTAVDGAPYRNDYVWIFELRDGRATRVEAFLDLAAYQAVIDRISLADSR